MKTLIPPISPRYGRILTAAFVVIAGCQLIPLEKRLVSPKYKVREEAMKKLMKLPDSKKTEVANLLLPYMKKQDSQMTNRAMNAMVNMGSSSVEALSTLIQDSDVYIRLSAVVALGQLGKNAAPAGPALMDRLRDEHPLIREESAFALGEMGTVAPPTATAMLKELEKSDKAPGVRHAAKEALQKLNPTPASSPKPLS